MTRARWIAGLAVVALGGLAAGLVLAPRVAVQRAEAALAARTGCRATVDSVELGVRETALTQTRLSCAFGEATFPSVVVEVGFVEAARGAPPRGIRVDGGSVVLWARPSAPSGGDRGVRAVAVASTRLQVRGLAVRVASGEQVVGHGTIDADGTTSHVELTVHDLETSEELHPRVEAREVVVALRRDGRTVVESGRIVGLRVRSVDRPELAGAMGDWIGRGDPSAEVGEGAPRWERLAEGGVLEISDGEVLDAEGLALGELEARIERLHGARFQTSGRGRPRGTGRVSWDLTVDAEAVAADGRLVLEEVPLSVLEPILPELPLHETSRAAVSADLLASTSDGDEIRLRGEARVRGLGLASARIASAPVVGIDVRALGSVTWDRPRHTIRLTDGEIVMGGARARVAGSAMMHEGRYAFDLVAELPSTDCDSAVHAIPAGLLQELVAMRLEGTIAGRIRARVDSERLDQTELRIDVTDRCRFVDVPPMAAVTRFQGPFLHQVLEPDDTLFEMETGPGTVHWAPIREISPFLVHSVLAHEDASFFSHSGFAPWAIRGALVRNLRERRYVLGASTITMQLVKNVFLRREKTLARKVQEVLLTWWLESAMTKEQILELYLNVIEYGPGVYGIRNASAHYFGRAPAELSVAESAYLAMILPNPPMFHEHYEAGEVPPAFRRRTERFVQLLHERGRIDADATQQGMDELAAFRFAHEGERVGPDELRGSAAQLPIEGFSGFPGTVAAETDEGVIEQGDAPDDDAEGWEEVWP